MPHRMHPETLADICVHGVVQGQKADGDNRGDGHGCYQELFRLFLTDVEVVRATKLEELY